MKITQEKMAKMANVTTRTIINWQKTKPELIRLITLGLQNNDKYIMFFNLFDGEIKLKGNEIWTLHNFYLDFYFRFLCFFNKNNQNISSVYILYLIQKEKKELFDPYFDVTEKDLNNFHRNNFKKPLLNISDKISDYIYENTQDDFQTLIKDTLYQDGIFFKNAILISVHYIIYKKYPNISYLNKKMKIDEITDKIDFEEENKEKLYKKYLNIKEEI